MSYVPMNLRRLVADVLPKGFEVAKTGEEEPEGGYEYFYVLDPARRRRTFSHASPTLDDLVKANLEKILKETQGCVEASAEMMGLSRASLYRKIKKYNIDIKDYRYMSQM